jgi:DNA-binding GntR family transcriptional regulator
MMIGIPMNKEPLTYQQQTYDYVRDQIINLGFKPGEYITDAQIAEKLNISRTPVREAFQRLEKEGLLVNEARHGWQVYKLDIEDIHEIFDLKIAVEGMIVHKAALCKDESLRKDLQEAFADMKNAVDAQDADYWLRTDVHLHNILIIMANNERAEKIVNNLNDQWHRLRLGFVAMQGMTRKSITEHDQFVRCVLAQDPEGAEMHMRAHLSRVRDDLIHLVVKVLMPYNDRGF